MLLLLFAAPVEKALRDKIGNEFDHFCTDVGIFHAFVEDYGDICGYLDV